MRVSHFGMEEVNQVEAGPDGSQPGLDLHDHAWRRMSENRPSSALSAEYRCDLCHVTWALRRSPCSAQIRP